MMVVREFVIGKEVMKQLLKICKSEGVNGYYYLVPRVTRNHKKAPLQKGM